MTDPCPITSKTNCRDRDCELHYMDAPLRVEPRFSFPPVAVFLIYMLCIPVANWMVSQLPPVAVAPGILAPAGVLVAGLAFTARDVLQRLTSRWVALAAIGAGSLLAFLVADPRIAVASVVAFAASEVADLIIFTGLERRTFLGAVAVSNAVGLVLDSVLFLWLAFGAFAFLPGQIIGKVWMTTLALLILIPLRRKLSVRHV